MQAQVSTIDGTVSSPSASDLQILSTGTFYDFLEFTVTNPNTSGSTLPLSLDIDTTQVDSFGLPMQLQLFQPAGAGRTTSSTSRALPLPAARRLRASPTPRASSRDSQSSAPAFLAERRSSRSTAAQDRSRST